MTERDENYLVVVAGGFTDGEAAQLVADGLRPIAGQSGTGGDQIRVRADTDEEALHRVISILGDDRHYECWKRID